MAKKIINEINIKSRNLKLNKTDLVWELGFEMHLTIYGYIWYSEEFCLYVDIIIMHKWKNDKFKSKYKLFPDLDNGQIKNNGSQKFWQYLYLADPNIFSCK